MYNSVYLAIVYIFNVDVFLIFNVYKISSYELHAIYFKHINNSLDHQIMNNKNKSIILQKSSIELCTTKLTFVRDSQ